MGDLGVPTSSQRRNFRVLPGRRGSVVGAAGLGDDEAADAAASETTASELVAQLLPTATSLIAASTTQDPEVLKAKVKNYRKLRNGARYGGVLWKLYDNRMRVVQAKYKASIREQAREEELKTSRREWSSLGKVGVVIGIGVGGALIALLLAASGRQRRIS